jgi:hypothetical protein
MLVAIRNELIGLSVERNGWTAAGYDLRKRLHADQHLTYPHCQAWHVWNDLTSLVCSLAASVDGRVSQVGGRRPSCGRANSTEVSVVLHSAHQCRATVTAA